MTLIVKTSITPNQATKSYFLADTTGQLTDVNPSGYGALQLPVGYRESSQLLDAEHYILPLSATFNYLGESTPAISEQIFSTSFNQAATVILANGTPQEISLLDNAAYVDGIYKSIYVNWFNRSLTNTVEQYDTNIVLASQPEDFTGAAFIKIDYLGTPKIYEILSISTNLITLNAEVPLDLTGASYEIGYLATSYFQNVHDINKCLHSDIAKAACSDCGCSGKKKEKLFTATMDFFGIQPNIDRGNYKCASEIISSITIYCSKNGCNC